MIHGASSNLEVMRQPLGDLLARKHRVILVDRPGHGWSSRESEADSTPEVQARMIAEAIQKLGIGRAILLVHSWSGALGARMALDHPSLVAGLIMLAPYLVGCAVGSWLRDWVLSRSAAVKPGKPGA